MKDSPIVSVIIPVYNAGKTLRECLDSVLQQTLSEIEIICVDDGSTDDSPQILQEYAEKDSRFRFLTQQNLNAGAARNAGMAAAAGKYLIFLDADDFFELTLLEDTVRLCEDAHADICIFSGWRFHDKKRTNEFMTWQLDTTLLPAVSPFSAGDIAGSIFQITKSAPWNKLFNAAFVQKNHIRFQGLSNSNDLCFVYTALSAAERIVCTEKPYVHYRIGQTTSIQAKKANDPLNFYYALKGLREELVQRGTFDIFESSFRRVAADTFDWNMKSFSLDVVPQEERDRVRNDLLSEKEEQARPKISIIIPAYNVERYITDCMDSAMHQTLQDIEIIAVNDGSTDGSLRLLQGFAAEDARVRVIDKQKNEGLLAARKSGVMAARGQYVIFLDADDTIVKEACEVLWAHLQKHPVSILQFGTNVIDHSGNEKKARWYKKALSVPSASKVRDKNYLLESAYIDHSIVTNLWSKAFRADLCRAVYEKLPDEHCYVGEDIFGFFFFCLYAVSYYAVPDKLYCYNYGTGVSNTGAMPLKKYELYCRMAEWSKYTDRFLQENNGSDMAKKAARFMAMRMCQDCCRILKFRISPNEKKDAAKILMNAWQNDPVFDDAFKHFYQLPPSSVFPKEDDSPEYYRAAARYKESDTVPKVTVIVPVYDVSKYIRKCLDSLLTQSLKELEIVCVNDGSHDDSLAILEEYAAKDDRIAVISQHNKGLSGARNAGMNVAGGKYVYFLDSDDWLADNAMELLYSRAEKDSLDMVMFSAQSVYESDAIFEKQHAAYDNNYLREPTDKPVVSGPELIESYKLNNGFRSSVPLQFYRREFLTENGLSFFEGIYHEDELFSAAVLPRARRLGICTEQLYYRLMRDDSIMTKKTSHRHVEGRFIVFARLLAEAMSYGPQDTVQREFLADRAKKMLFAVRRDYKKLSKKEQKKVLALSGAEYQTLFREIIVKQSVRSRLRRLIPSPVRRVLNGLPGKLKRLKSYYKIYGLKNTVKRVFSSVSLSDDI